LGRGENSHPQKAMVPVACQPQGNSGLPAFETGPFGTLAFIHAEHYSSHLLLQVWPNSMWNRSMCLPLNMWTIMLTPVQSLFRHWPQDNNSVSKQHIVSDIFILMFFHTSQSHRWQHTGMHKKLCTYRFSTRDIQVYIPILCLSMICGGLGQSFQARTAISGRFQICSCERCLWNLLDINSINI